MRNRFAEQSGWYPARVFSLGGAKGVIFVFLEISKSVGEASLVMELCTHTPMIVLHCGIDRCVTDPLVWSIKAPENLFSPKRLSGF